MSGHRDGLAGRSYSDLTREEAVGVMNEITGPGTGEDYVRATAEDPGAIAITPAFPYSSIVYTDDPEGP